MLHLTHLVAFLKEDRGDQHCFVRSLAVKSLEVRSLGSLKSKLEATHQVGFDNQTVAVCLKLSLTHSEIPLKLSQPASISKASSPFPRHFPHFSSAAIETLSPSISNEIAAQKAACAIDNRK
jgi:hypothetical protein